MPRRLDVIQRLLREPCPVDPSTLPRTSGGLDCGKCGRIVVDVAGLTFDEAVEFRRRARRGGERVCGAYTVDRDERVLLRASPNSSALVAVAVSVLLSACETHAPSGTESVVHASPAPAQSAAVHAPSPRVDPTPTAAPAPVALAAIPASEAASAASAKEGEPPCAAQRSPGSSRERSRRKVKDLQVLAGY